MPARRIQTYANDAITVTFDPNRCTHAARCLQSLPAVFDVGRRKWIELTGADPDEVANTVARCPSGALQYTRLDNGPPELPDPVLTVRPQRNGPLHVRGDLELKDAAGGTIAHGPRFSLCRCGESQNKPFCDNTHRLVRFTTET